MPEQFDPYHLWLGIPPAEQPPNHYRLLGLRAFEDNSEVISYAVDQRAAHLRSFQSGKRSADSQRLVNEVAAAGICLLDPAKRLQYDRQLRAKIDAEKPEAPAPPPAPTAQPPRSPRIPVARSLEPEPQPTFPIVQTAPKTTAPQPSAQPTPPQPSDNSRTKLIIIVASAAACLFVLAAGGVGWWWMNRATTGPIVVQPSPPDPTPPDPTPPDPTPPDPTPPAPASREAWLPAGNAERVIRNVKGQWIEYHPKGQFWLNSVASTTDYVELADARRGIDLRLYADRLELKSPRQDWAVVGPGKWAAEAELPPFARELPRRTGTGPVKLDTASQGLAFCGSDYVQAPVPPELKGSVGDWTVETWVRWDPYDPGQAFLTLDNLSANLTTHRIIKADGTTTVALNWNLAGQRDLAALPSDQWRHVAMVRRGSDLVLFLDGREVHREKVATDRTFFGSHIMLGGGKDGLCGFVRDFRVSKGARYSAAFTPPLRFAADDQTLSLLAMKVVTGPTIDDVSGHGNSALRKGTRWIHLTSDAQLSVERADGSLDLLRAFAAAADPLEGNDVRKWPEPEDKVEAGKPGQRTRVLLPLRAAAEYDVRVNLTRLEGDGGAFLGLSIAGQPAILVIDGPELGGRTGILPRLAQDNATASTLVPGPPILRTGASTPLTVQVRLNGTEGYTVTLQRPDGGTTVINGKIAELGGPAEFRIPNQYGFSFGALGAKIRFDNFHLQPVTANLPLPLLAALGSSGGSTVPVGVPPTPPAVPTGGRDNWLAGDGTIVVRQSGGRWVEIHDKDAYWFDSAVTVRSDHVQLADPRRGVDVRLFADRMELKSARQDWAVASTGAWKTPGELPAFASRGLPPPETGPFVPSAPAQALVFGGKETLRVPIPQALRSGPADCTIEMWLRIDPLQPTHRVLADERDLLLSLAQDLGNPSGPRVLQMSWLSGNSLAMVAPERWTHLALQRSGKNWRLFVDGKSAGSGAGAPEQLAADALVLGAQVGGLCGIVRDFRVSRGQRYASDFTPPLKLAADASALVVLHMKASRSNTVRNLAPGGEDATRDGARWIPLTDERQLAADRPDGSVDLIQSFAVLDDPLEGRDVSKWATKVEAGQPGGRTRMLIPCLPGAEYDLSVEVTRLVGDGGAFIGLSIAGKPVMLAIDGFPELGGRTGILPADLSQVGTVSFMPDLPPMLETGTPAKFTIQVRRPDADNFSVRLSRAGSKGGPLFNGKVSDIRVPPEFQIPFERGMSFGALDARVRFADFVLHNVSSGAPSAVPAPGPSPSPAPAPMPTPPVAARQPVPAQELLTAKRKEAQEIYAAELKQATKPGQKALLARTIYKAGETTQNDQAARYVLFDIARIVYIQAGEVSAALLAARQIEREFDVPTNELLAATITALNAAPTVIPEQRAALARAAAELADELIAGGQVERADDLASIAVQSAAKQKDADLKKEMQQRRAQVERVVKEYGAVKPHLETLAASPNDPAANLGAGKFHCLVLEDWDRGLPQLVLAEGSPLSGPAKLDQEAGDDVRKQLAAAEAWLDVVESNRELDREEKVALQRRAKLLLQGPASELTGLDQVKAQKRLQELQGVQLKAGAKPKPKTPDPRPTAPTAVTVPRGTRGASGASGTATYTHELIGRVQHNGRDPGILVVCNDARLDPGDIARLQQLLPGGGEVSLQLRGALTIPREQKILVVHGGGGGGGVNTLEIDGVKFNDVGSNGKGESISKSITLAGGTHDVRWTLGGSALAPGFLIFTTEDEPKFQPQFKLAPDQDDQGTARRVPTQRQFTTGDTD